MIVLIHAYIECGRVGVSDSLRKRMRPCTRYTCTRARAPLVTLIRSNHARSCTCMGVANCEHVFFRLNKIRDGIITRYSPRLIDPRAKEFASSHSSAKNCQRIALFKLQNSVSVLSRNAYS